MGYGWQDLFLLATHRHQAFLQRVGQDDTFVLFERGLGRWVEGNVQIQGHFGYQQCERVRNWPQPFSKAGTRSLPSNSIPVSRARRVAGIGLSALGRSRRP